MNTATIKAITLGIVTLLATACGPEGVVYSKRATVYVPIKSYPTKTVVEKHRKQTSSIQQQQNNQNVVVIHNQGKERNRYGQTHQTEVRALHEEYVTPARRHYWEPEEVERVEQDPYYSHAPVIYEAPRRIESHSSRNVTVQSNQQQQINQQNVIIHNHVTPAPSTQREEIPSTRSAQTDGTLVSDSTTSASSNQPKRSSAPAAQADEGSLFSTAATGSAAAQLRAEERETTKTEKASGGTEGSLLSTAAAGSGKNTHLEKDKAPVAITTAAESDTLVESKDEKAGETPKKSKKKTAQSNSQTDQKALSTDEDGSLLSTAISGSASADEAEKKENGPSL